MKFNHGNVENDEIIMKKMNFIHVISLRLYIFDHFQDIFYIKGNVGLCVSLFVPPPSVASRVGYGFTSEAQLEGPSLCYHLCLW